MCDRNIKKDSCPFLNQDSRNEEKMKKLIALIAEEIKEAFVECGYEERFGQVNLSNRPDLCQYQCNGALMAAKQYKKAPLMIAKEVVEKLQGSDWFETVDAAAPGFINLNLKPSMLATYLQGMSEEECYGFEKVAEPETIVIDYGGANVAKPLHIGHLRSAIIGESIKRICRYAGNQVISDVHLGDWGLQMGLIIEELHDRQPELPYFNAQYVGEYPSEAPFTISELEEIYPAASARSKADEAFKERAQQATMRLQQGYAPYRALWKHILNVSIQDLKKNYTNLNVDFDLWKGESDAQPYIPDMVEDMIARGLAYESQGAMVVDIQEETDTKEYPPCIVRKSDGAALYATSDLATLIEREKLYQPKRYIYLADKRQEMHFTQVFRVAKKAGIVGNNTGLTFLGFGTMNGKDGKPFKTRSGGVMRLEHLIADTNEEVYKKIMENRQIEEEEARIAAQKIGLASIKYADLSNQAAKDYVFDMERFTSFEGNTGPYILYTMVRIKSILAKYKEMNPEAVPTAINAVVREYNASEIEIMLQAAKFNDVLAHAYEEIAPHKICQYIYDLANAFNSFYHENRIIGETDEKKQAQWIAMIQLVLQLLEVCIDLLGFEAPERM